MKKKTMISCNFYQITSFEYILCIMFCIMICNNRASFSLQTMKLADEAEAKVVDLEREADAVDGMNKESSFPGSGCIFYL